MKEGPAYKYGYHNDANYALQEALTEHGFDTKGKDGDFGNDTRDAVEAAQQHFNISPPDGVPRADLLSFLGIAAPSKPPASSIFDQIGTLVSILNLLKGKTMTQDQINGILRAILTAVGGYFVNHGFVTGSVWDWITAGVLTIGPMVWSWISNRPKTIVPIAAK